MWKNKRCHIWHTVSCQVLQQPLAIWGLMFQVRLWTHTARSWMALTLPWRQEVRGQWAFWHFSLTYGAPHVFFVPLGEGTTWPGRAANVRGYIYREMSRRQYFWFFSVSVTLCRLVLFGRSLSLKLCRTRLYVSLYCSEMDGSRTCCDPSLACR